MRQQLLSNTVEDAASSSRIRPLARLRGGDDVQVVLAGCGGFCFVLTLFMSFFVASVSPLEYGLLKSGLNGNVMGSPVQGGLHFVLPWQTYLSFPATRVTLEWSHSYNAQRPPISSRTGADPHDPDSGGQPISISCAIQIVLKPETLRQIFLNFGSYAAAKQRYILLAGNVVSNTAQEFTPQDFWKIRHTIANRMWSKINDVLEKQGATIISYQIMKVEFADTFENSITGVQVAEQQQVVNEYNMQVQQVEQQIAVLNSHNGATIALIHANAVRTGKETVGNATKAAFIMKQEAKANSYAELQKALQFTPAQMAEYIKIRSFMAQSANGKVVVNVPPPSVASGPL